MQTVVAVDTNMKNGLTDVKPESLVKEFSSKDFAKGASGPRMTMCESLGLQLNEFLTLALEGMHSVSSEFGL